MPDSIARRVAELVRQRAIAALVRHDQALSRIYDQIAEGVRRDLRATQFSIAEVRAILEKHFGGNIAERRAIIEDAILEAAREARVLPQETFDAIYGRGPDAVNAAPFDRASSARKSQLLQLVRESEGEPASMD